jgi:hypothetical protein
LGDSGVYKVEDGTKVLTPGYVLTVLPASTTVPVTGLIGLGLLAAAGALGGASVIRRKK